jgi:hypothetical protein
MLKSITTIINDFTIERGIPNITIRE